jgi:large subunit ribosomal protein L24
MASLDILRNDTVQVISGSDTDKKGRVLRVFPDTGRILVEHVHIVKKHMKENPQRRIKGGIAEQEATIHLSNVMLLDSEGNKTRAGVRMEGDRKVRFAKSNDLAIPEKGKKK